MIKKVLICLALVASMLLVTPADTASAKRPVPEGGGSCTSASFLGLPAWYDGLTKVSGTSCVVKSPSEMGGDAKTQLSRFIWKIALNIIKAALMIVGYVSVGFLIYGGFRYITSAGDSNGVASAKKTILNAIIGLVLSFASVAIVSLVTGAIK